MFLKGECKNGVTSISIKGNVLFKEKGRFYIGKRCFVETDIPVKEGTNLIITGTLEKHGKFLVIKANNIKEVA